MAEDTGRGPAMTTIKPATSGERAGSGNALARLIARACPPAGSRYEDFLPDAKAISQRRHSPYATVFIGLRSLMVVAALAWMHIARIEEVTSAPGIVRPAVPSRAMSHPEGGRLARILVREGETVQEGQPLVLLDGTAVRSEITRLTVLLDALTEEIEHLRAERRRPPSSDASIPGSAAATIARLAEVVAARDNASSALQRQQALLGNLVLRAPIDGVLVSVRRFNPGAVIAAGETIAEIMPAGGARRLEIEAHVVASDIGDIAVGQAAIVRIQAYDWSRYGTLKGTVVYIAPDAVVPAASHQAMLAMSHPYFIVRIALDKDYVGNDPQRNRVAPGMIAAVDLPVGEHSVLDYVAGGFLHAAGGIRGPGR